MLEKSLLELKNITKYYGEERALHNISLHFLQNTVTALIGPNGAGKSTLIKILLSLIPYTSGTMVSSKKITFAYAPETSTLYPDLTVGYFLNWIKKVKHKSIDQLHTLIELFELEHHIHKKIKHLSKGYKRRLLIIQAIIGDENFVILDEPTDGLDIEFKFKLRNILKNLTQNKTLIICTHESIILNQLADRIVLLDKGDIIYDGLTNDLKSKDGKLYIEDIYMRAKQ